MNRQDIERPEPDLELDVLAGVVVDAALEVHSTLGPGFLESAYEQALAVELALREIPFAQQVPIELAYKDVPIGRARLDFLVDSRLVVELKASESLLPIHQAQVFSYLKAAQLPLGLLINFNVRLLQQGIRRVIRTPPRLT